MPFGSSLTFYLVFISPKLGDAHTRRGLMFKNVFSIFFKDWINKDRTNKGPNNIPNNNCESSFTLPSKHRHNIQFLKILNFITYLPLQIWRGMKNVLMQASLNCRLSISFIIYKSRPQLSNKSCNQPRIFEIEICCNNII